MLSFQLHKQLREFALDVSLEVSAHTLALIGHSGCGKTTMLQILAGLVEADRGRVELDGRILYDSKQKIDVLPEHRDIGMVFQQYALFPHLSVGDNIAYGLQSRKRQATTARVIEMLRMFNLEELSEAKPSALSGGQQQRVALARALAKRPKLLLLDEPLSALDVETRGHVRAELRALLDRVDIPCIVVTHDYEDARVLGQEIAVMDRGVIVQRGTPQDIGERPATRFVAQFAGTNWVADTDDATAKGTSMALSFDPWHAAVTRTRPTARRQWRGHVHDLATYGSFLRLWVRGEVPLVADVSRLTEQDAQYQVGDEVYVSVADGHVRRFEVHVPDKQDPAGAEGDEKEWQSGLSGNHVEDGTSIVRWRPASRLRFVRSPLTATAALIAAVGIIAGSTSFTHAQGTLSSGFGRHTTLIGFVAANATDPFNAIIRLFEQAHPGVAIQASYTGTQILQTQLQQGAPDDLFLSADRSHIAQIMKEGLIPSFYPVSHDVEVIVAPKANPAHIRSLADLGTHPVSLIIGVTSVPIGKYTREIFQKANAVYGSSFATNVMSHVVSEEINVKQILEKVALGDAEAGIVYQTDVTPNMRSKVSVIPIPKQLNVIATNYIAIPVHAPHPALARKLLQMMLSPKGQAVFRHFGYQPLTAGGGAR